MNAFVWYFTSLSLCLPAVDLSLWHTFRLALSYRNNPPEIYWFLQQTSYEQSCLSSLHFEFILSSFGLWSRCQHFSFMRSDHLLPELLLQSSLTGWTDIFHISAENTWRKATERMCKHISVFSPLNPDVSKYRQTVIYCTTAFNSYVQTWCKSIVYLANPVKF